MLFFWKKTEIWGLKKANSAYCSTLYNLAAELKSVK